MSRAESPVAAIMARAALCLATATTVAAVAAATVTLSGLSGEMRRALRFGFAGVEHSPAEVARITLNNARVAGGTLLCAAIAPKLGPRARRLVFVVLATVLTCSAAAVGAAVGAYGTRAIAALALHLPVEFTALSLAGGAYLHAGKQALGTREFAATAALTGLLLIAAATLETYTSIEAAR
jgi:hypothetical protein